MNRTIKQNEEQWSKDPRDWSLANKLDYLKNQMGLSDKSIDKLTEEQMVRLINKFESDYE